MVYALATRARGLWSQQQPFETYPEEADSGIKLALTRASIRWSLLTLVPVHPHEQLVVLLFDPNDLRRGTHPIGLPGEVNPHRELRVVRHQRVPGGGARDDRRDSIDDRRLVGRRG